MSEEFAYFKCFKVLFLKRFAKQVYNVTKPCIYFINNKEKQLTYEQLFHFI